MRVAIDAMPLTVPAGGIRRYTEQLSVALREEFPEDEYLLLGEGGWTRRWWSLGLGAEMLRRRLDLFHGTDFAVPYLPLRPAVMTVHDLSPWREDCREITSARVRTRTPVLLRLGLATMVITLSEAVRRELLARFPLAPARVTAVPLAAAPVFRPGGGAAPPRPYFLLVGPGGPRKNFETVLAAWRELRPAASLVIAGCAAVAPADGLVAAGAVADEELARWYQGAAALLMPSLYEGFGLPAVEAMQCGTPVIVSRDPALMELAAGAAPIVDFQDVRAWRDAMRAVLVHRQHWSALALARARAFSWSRTARLTRQVYQEALDRFGS